jgi:adhesin transport system outer membrane protein
MKRFLSIVLLLSTGCALAQPLDEAIQNALITNPDLLFNTSKTLTDKQRIDVAKGAYYPSIDIRGSIGREESENPTTLAIDGATKRTLDRR